MSEYTVEYDTLEERLQAVEDAEAQGHVMRHDDFDVGVEKSHRLTFENDPPGPLPPTAEEIDFLAIQAKAHAVGGPGVTLPEVIEVLKFKGIL